MGGFVCCPNPIDASFHYERAKIFVWIAEMQYFDDLGKVGTFSILYQILKPVKLGLFLENRDK
jgi:hypothetical protein